MTLVETMTKEVDSSDLNVDQDEMSGELYDLLCQHCTGEALSVIRGVDDMQGIKTWQRLFKKYNPKKIARMIRLLGEVVSPYNAHDVRGLETSLNKWEDKLRILEKEFGEKFSEGMQIAIVVSSMPPEIQEYVYANIAEGGQYKDISQRIRVIAGNKAAMMTGGPVPMDIGMLAGGRSHDESSKTFDDECGACDGDDVNAIGMHTQCYNCQGWGHAKRDWSNAGERFRQRKVP
jgi:hypothetical protein